MPSPQHPMAQRSIQPVVPSSARFVQLVAVDRASEVAVERASEVAVNRVFEVAVNRVFEVAQARRTNRRTGGLTDMVTGVVEDGQRRRLLYLSPYRLSCVVHIRVEYTS